VTEERILDTARIAADRLKPLGLRVIEIDLGWQAKQLPSTFEENSQFPRGLKWLSGELGKLGFDLGVWSAPYSISEFDPVAAGHPEWLVKDAGGAPFSQGEWFWQPHGKVFILDLTHPGAQAHLRAKMKSLDERGVRYLKSDFIGCASDDRARIRHEQKIVGGGGLEAARIGAKIIRESLPGALLLNCGGPEMPGTGQ
jgi:alpha-galactosidase